MLQIQWKLLRIKNQGERKVGRVERKSTRSSEKSEESVVCEKICILVAVSTFLSKFALCFQQTVKYSDMKDKKDNVENAEERVRQTGSLRER